MRSERLRKRAEQSLKSGETVESEPKKKKSKAEKDEEKAEKEVKTKKSGKGKSPKKPSKEPEPEEAPEKETKETTKKGKKGSKKEDKKTATEEKPEKEAEKGDEMKEESSTKEAEKESTDAAEKEKGEDIEKEESKEKESKAEAEKDSKKQEEKDTGSKSFPDDFPSLVPHFGTDSKVPLVGLLFSAGWCPDCKPVVPKIASLLTKVDDSSSMIRVVYVSSDETADEMEKFIESSGGKDVFSTIPFGNTDEIKQLKLHFKTCAKKEMKDVGVDEVKGGIPTLKIFSAKTGAVVSEDAVADFEKLTPTTAPEEWKKLADGDSASKES